MITQELVRYVFTQTENNHVDYRFLSCASRFEHAYLSYIFCIYKKEQKSQSRQNLIKQVQNGGFQNTFKKFQAKAPVQNGQQQR